MAKNLISILFFLTVLNFKAQIAYSWAKPIGGANADDGQCMAQDASGNIYMAGAFQGTVDFDPGPGTYTLVSAGGDDAYISKFDANGNFISVYTFTNNLACKIYGIAIDNNGNIITTGGFSGSVDFDPSASVTAMTSNGANDVFVTKLNSNGSLAWVKAFGSFGTDDLGISISSDQNSNILVTGYFQGSNVNFDVGGSNFTMSSTSGAKDVFVLKYNSAGVFSWAFKIGGPGTDVGQVIKADASGDIVVGGLFSFNPDFDPGAGSSVISSPGGNDAFIAKYTNGGAFVWAANFSGVFDEVCYSLSVDASGDIYATGTFKGTTDFDPGAGTFTLNSTGGLNEDVFISKLSSAGALSWAKQMGGAAVDFGTSISSDASGIYVGGYFAGVSDFDPSSTTAQNLASAGSNDVFISKVDLSGNFLFAKNIGGVGNDLGRAILTPSTNVIYATGSFSSIVDFDISPLATAVYTSNGNTDAFLLKFQPCSAQAVSVTASSPTVCASSSSNLSAVGAVNYTWSTGATTSSIVVTPSVTTAYSVSAMTMNGCVYSNSITIQVVVCSNVEEDTQVKFSKIKFYPNPSSESISIDVKQSAELEIIDVTGSVIKKMKLDAGANRISVLELNSGIYYLIVHSGDTIVAGKMEKL